jgi:hypothetical protein
MANAQSKINGIVTDIANDEPMAYIKVKNVNSGELMVTDSSGKWHLTVKNNDLIELYHLNFETIRIRVKNAKSPSYYSLIMRPKTNKLMNIIVRDKNPTYKADSFRRQELYANILIKPDIDEFSASTAPIAQMSRKFQEEQAFKGQYLAWEKEKFVDYMFNAKQIKKWTGLEGDKLDSFMKTYRPTYEYLRSVSEYNYLMYVKKSLAEFCPSCEFRKRKTQ